MARGTAFSVSVVRSPTGTLLWCARARNCNAMSGPRANFPEERPLGVLALLLLLCCCAAVRCVHGALTAADGYDNVPAEPVHLRHPLRLRAHPVDSLQLPWVLEGLARPAACCCCVLSTALAPSCVTESGSSTCSLRSRTSFRSSWRSTRSPRPSERSCWQPSLRTYCALL